MKRAKGNKLGVWLADASNVESVFRIGKMIKDMLGTDTLHIMGFTVHKDEKVRSCNEKRPTSFYLQKNFRLLWKVKDNM